jgi:hypothetical protein
MVKKDADGSWNMEHGGRPMVLRLVLLQSLHSMCEIGPVKGDDIPRHANGDVAVGNAQQWGRKQRESIMFGGLEAPHLLFTQSRGLVGVFRSIVEPFVLAMLYTRQDLTFRGSITLQFIRDDHTWYVV